RELKMTVVEGWRLGSGFHADSIYRSMFRSKLTARRWNVAIWLSKSFIALPSDAAQSFRIVGPLLFAASSSGFPGAGKVDRDAGVSKDSAAVRRVFAPPP